MFAVIYRWKIREGLEKDFERGWHMGTAAIIRDLGGLGSRLHKSGPGAYFAYALWPDEDSYQRNRDARMPYENDEARALYTRALEDSETEVVLCGDVIDDLLVPEPTDDSSS